MAKHRRIRFIVAAVTLLLLLASCQKRGLQELVRDELFPLSLGRMEDQIDLFQLDGETAPHSHAIAMSDGLFYIADGNASKIMVFSSYGDLIFLIYNPETNPAPALLSSGAGSEAVSTRASVSYPFKNIGRIAVASDKTFYAEDDVPAGKGVKDEKSGAYLNRIILRFDRKGKADGYIGQEGIGGTPFPYVMGLYVTNRDQLVVVCRLPSAWQVFWYSKKGALLYQAEIDQAHLPVEKGYVSSLTNIFPDLQSPALYLMIYYYRETVDEGTRAQSSIEDVFSRVHKLNLTKEAYESFVEIPPNPSRKEKAGFKTMEFPAPPSELLGVGSTGCFYLLGFMDANLFVLTILDPAGRVKERRSMVIEDSELTYRELRLSPSGMVYGLLCDKTKAYVTRWRSDLLLKGD